MIRVKFVNQRKQLHWIYKYVVYSEKHNEVRDDAAHSSKSISTGAQYVTLDNKIKCLRLALFFFFLQPQQ
jgi:hypothetical protein